MDLTIIHTTSNLPDLIFLQMRCTQRTPLPFSLSTHLSEAGEKQLAEARVAGGRFWLLAGKHGRGFFMDAASSARDAILPSQSNGTAVVPPFPLEERDGKLRREPLCIVIIWGECRETQAIA